MPTSPRVLPVERPPAAVLREPAGPPAAARARPLVVTAPVEIDSTGTEIRAIGTAQAAKAVTLYPQVTGVVAKIAFTPGGAVAAGDPLLVLDSADQEIAVERARVALDKADEAVARAERLSKTGNVTAVALSDASVAKRQAEIDMKSAELELAKRTIRAPFSGVAGLTDLSIGDLVNSQKAIATVDDMATVDRCLRSARARRRDGRDRPGGDGDGERPPRRHHRRQDQRRGQPRRSRVANAKARGDAAQ